MRILLIAATKFEIEPFIVNNKDVEILICGVGIPSTCYHLQKKLQQNKIDLVVQAGIAGTFNNEIALGEVLLVKQDIFADIGMEEKGYFTSIYETGFTEKNEFPYQDGWLINDHAIFNFSKLQNVKAITINKISDSFLQKQQALTNFSPQIESMEGAALHYVCLQEKIPFIQIRSISNLIGERDKSKWKLKEAITNLNIELSILMKQLIEGQN